MGKKVWTAVRVISSLGLIELHIVVGDLISASFKSEDPDFIVKKVSANRNKITATYDLGVDEIFCSDPHVRDLLWERRDRIKNLRVGHETTFSAQRSA
jgi:hypothetical protein